MPHHLESALRAMRRQPSAGAHFSGYGLTASEIATRTDFSREPFIWHMARRPSVFTVWEIDFISLVAASVLYTPFHLSTMFLRTTSAPEGVRWMGDSNPLNLDRLMYLGLARSGGVLFEPSPSTFVRWYAGNWSKDKSNSELRAIVWEGSLAVMALAREAGVDVAARWEEAEKEMALLAPDVAVQIRSFVRHQFSDDQMVGLGLDRAFRVPLRRDERWNPLTTAARILRPWTPPIVFRAAKRMLRRGS